MGYANKMDALDLVISVLKEHEKKLGKLFEDYEHLAWRLDILLQKYEDTGDFNLDQIDPEKLTEDQAKTLLKEWLKKGMWLTHAKNGWNPKPWVELYKILKVLFGDTEK